MDRPGIHDRHFTEAPAASDQAPVPVNGHQPAEPYRQPLPPPPRIAFVNGTGETRDERRGEFNTGFFRPVTIG